MCAAVSGPRVPVGRRVVGFTHSASPLAERLTKQASQLLARCGWELVEVEQLDAELPGQPAVAALVFGGDGTLLRAADQLRGRAIPIVGVNVGHLGFLTEAEADDLPTVIDRLVSGDYWVEDRATLTAVTTQPDGQRQTGWALNEVALEKVSPQRMIEVRLEVDGRPLSTFGCDGVVLATPTGSTGHAFSAGGPVVWPAVEALLVVPVSAHALFARPLVVAPPAVIVIELLDQSRSPGMVAFDGQRGWPLAAGGRLEVGRAAEPVRLIRFGEAPFADRLVRKFALPVAGWRSPAVSAG